MSEPYGDLLDLLADDAPGVTHVCLPDFSLACGIGFLDKGRADRVHLGTPARWADVTCPWCRAIGRAYCRHAIDSMQRRAA